jgi:magnesium transporter
MAQDDAEGVTTALRLALKPFNSTLMTDFSDITGSATEAYELTPEFIRSVSEALAHPGSSHIRDLLEPLHSADLAYLIDMLSSEERERLVEILRDRFDPEVLVDLNPEVREEIVYYLGTQASAEVISQLESDVAVSVIEELSEEDQKDILEAIPLLARTAVEEGLSYPERSAGRLMRKKVVIAPEEWNVGNAIDFLRTSTNLPKDFYALFVVDQDQKPVGSVLVSRIIRSARDAAIRDIMDCEPRLIPAEMDQEEVAFIFRKYGLTSAPVIGEDGRIHGMLTIEDILEVIEEEAGEDLMRLGGVIADDYFSAVRSTVQRRFPWLFVNMITALIGSYVISQFSGTIEKLVALASLMPIVASMGGNTGTQAVTVAVRALATRELSSINARRAVTKELMVGLAHGLILATMVGLVSFLWHHDAQLSGIFAIAVVLNLTCAGLAGVLIPLTLDRLDVDPAIASGVFLTAITDIFGFFLFLGLATWMLAL